MQTDRMLANLNKDVASIAGGLKEAEKSLTKMAETATGKLKSGFANLTAAAGRRWDERTGGTGVMPNSLGKITPAAGQGGGGQGGGGGPVFSTSAGGVGGSDGSGRNGALGKMHAVFSGWGGSGGSGGGSVAGGSGDPFGGGNSPGASQGKALARAAAVASAAWQSTPGVRDAVSYQSTVFPVAFATSGQYDNKKTGNRVLDAINGGASSPFDPMAAAAAMTYSGYTMNMGNTADRMLTTAGAMYQLTGMNNVASVMGSMALSQGTGGVQDKLMRAGITTVGSNGDPRDLGAIIDQLWNRWYQGKNVTEAQLDRDIAMGYVGADLQELFGNQPALYQQAVMLLRLKAKEGGRSGIRLSQKSGKNSAIEVAKKYGLDEYNSPMAATGDINTSQGKLLLEASEGLLSGFVGATNTEQAAASAGAALIEFTGPLSDATLALKGFTQGLQAAPTAGPWATLGISALTSLFSGGGEVDGLGGTTADSISARLSRGEFVINARAAQQIGLKNLKAMNSLGHTFGSGFASPAGMFSEGGEVNGADVVELATKYVGTPYVDSATLKGGQSSASPKNGWDCSTFTHWVYKQFGQNLPMYSDSYQSVGTQVSRDDLQPGDLLLWHTNSAKDTGHISIYAGNGEHVHAANPETGTVREKISDWYWDRFVMARRVDSSTLSPPNGPGVNEAGSDGDGSPYSNPGALRAGGQIGGKVEYANSYASIMSTSLAPLGKSAGRLGAFNSGGVSAGSLSTNSSLLVRGTPSIFAGVGAGADKLGQRKVSGAGSGDDTAGTGEQSNPTVDGSNMSREEWARTILGALGAPLNETTTNAMLTWMRHEGGHWNNSATYNPLNTTKVMDGNDKSINSHGVKAYSDWQEGINATLATIRKDAYGYPKILSQFQKGSDEKGIYSAINKSEWGTKTLPGYAHGVENVSREGTAQLHQGEMVFPAAVAQDFRDALREALNGGGSKQPVNITLNIERASEAEAEKFAKQVMSLINQNQNMERIRTR